VIWKITDDSKISIFAGNATGESGTTDATGTLARFTSPTGLAWQGDKLYVADYGNNAIRVITPDGAVTTLAGVSGTSGDYQDGANTGARFNGPTALTVDKNGNVYVAEWGNNLIRKITPDGSTFLLAGEYYSNFSVSGLPHRDAL